MAATKRDLAVRVQEKLDISNAAAQGIVTAVVEAQMELLVEQEKLLIVGLGTFTVTHHAERRARNPQTGGTVVAPAGKRVKFRASSMLKGALSQ